MTGRYRYYLTEGDSPEREVTKAQFVSAERRAGFYNTMGQPDEPATGGFGGRHGDTKIRGRVEFAGDGEPVPLTPAGLVPGPVTPDA